VRVETRVIPFREVRYRDAMRLIGFMGIKVRKKSCMDDPDRT